MTNHYGFHEISGLRRKKGYNDKTKVSEVRDPMSQSILIVDDEVQVLEILSSFLEREGFQIMTAQTGPEALEITVEKKPSLVLLDWMLPGMNGIDVCRELRKVSNAGIIMVTARTEEMDKILGLEVGADDYITKPFSLRELLARIRSVLRRIEGHHPTVQPMQRGDLLISEVECRVWKRDKEIPLTPTEFKLLVTLAAKPGIVYSRLQLLQAALEDDILNDERTVDAHISRLRKKIEDNPSKPTYIQTVYGFGYQFGDGQ